MRYLMELLAYVMSELRLRDHLSQRNRLRGNMKRPAQSHAASDSIFLLIHLLDPSGCNSIAQRIPKLKGV